MSDVLWLSAKNCFTLMYDYTVVVIVSFVFIPVSLVCL
jgi:hypothetical protein